MCTVSILKHLMNIHYGAQSKKALKNMMHSVQGKC